mgnify:CR=1 FL=1
MSYNCIKDKGFIKIDDWSLNNHNRLNINYPPEIETIPGIIAILVNNRPVLFSFTSHFGPRIRDFKHSINGTTANARIHAKIVEALNANETVSLWVKHSSLPREDRNALLQECNPEWNL